ncbi:MAG TPA: helix-turn-helix domain-containing protein [Actinomycetota bacterium]
MAHRDPESARFDRLAGAALRRAREAVGLTLHEVAERSGGRFKPSTVAGYERGERSISLGRFAQLATVYDRPPDQLLGEVLEDIYPSVRGGVAIDESRLAFVEEPAREAMRWLLRRVRERRISAESPVLTIRAGDLRVAILRSGEEPGTVLRKLRPAMVESGGAS